MTDSTAYDTACATANAASAKFRETQTAYRVRKIGDEAFLAARKIWQAAEKAFDVAYAARVAELEAEELCTSDAQGVADAERMKQQEFAL